MWHEVHEIMCLTKLRYAHCTLRARAEPALPLVHLPRIYPVSIARQLCAYCAFAVRLLRVCSAATACSLCAHYVLPVRLLRAPCKLSAHWLRGYGVFTANLPCVYWATTVGPSRAHCSFTAYSILV